MLSMDQLHTYLSNNRIQLGIGATAAVTAYLLHRWSKKCYNLPPGPTPLPIVGNAFGITDNRLWFWFMELKEKYGNVFTIHLLGSPIVILNSFDLVNEAFVKKSADFAGRPQSITSDAFNPSILFGQYGPVWRLQRKIVHEAFRKYATDNQMEGLIDHSMDIVCELLMKQNDTPFDPYDSLNLLICNIFGGMCAGKEFEIDDSIFSKIIKKLDDLNDQFMVGIPEEMFPLLAYQPIRSAAYKKFKEDADFMNSFFMDIYRAHRDRFDPDNVTDITDYLVKTAKEAEKEEDKTILSSLTEQHFALTLSNIFVAGLDTTRHTLYWLVQYMAAYPNVQRKMQQQIDEVLGARVVRMADRVQLPYVEAVLREVMRMRLIIPLAVPHETLCDTSVGGFDIPKGCQVWPNMWALHYDPKEWDSPEEFRPERFLDEDGAYLTPTRSFLPFSAGHRSCVGEALAKAELQMLTAMLFQKFTFLPPPGESMSLEMEKTSLLVACKPYKIVATPRA